MTDLAEVLECHRHSHNTVLIDLRRGIVPYFFVTVIVKITMILAMFIFYFCLKQQDKHCIRHYDFDYDCDYDIKIRYKYGPLYITLPYTSLTTG